MEDSEFKGRIDLNKPVPLSLQIENELAETEIPLAGGAAYGDDDRAGPGDPAINREGALTIT